MKLISPLTKEIDYFGLKIKVSESHKFVATDESGDVYGYEFKPEINNHDDDYWYDPSGDWELIAKVDLEGIDWKDTLRKI